MAPTRLIWAPKGKDHLNQPSHGGPLRENPGLKVKLLVGPTCKIPLDSKGLFGNKANLRCAKIRFQVRTLSFREGIPFGFLFPLFDCCPQEVIALGKLVLRDGDYDLQNIIRKAFLHKKKQIANFCVKPTQILTQIFFDLQILKWWTFLH